MKKAIAILAICFALKTNAQSKDSLVVRIEMDSTTFKNVVQLIQENINGQTKSGQLILQNILAPLYQNLRLVPREKMVADKPKK